MYLQQDIIEFNDAPGQKFMIILIDTREGKYRFIAQSEFFTDSETNLRVATAENSKLIRRLGGKVWKIKNN